MRNSGSGTKSRSCPRNTEEGTDIYESLFIRSRGDHRADTQLSAAAQRCLRIQFYRQGTAFPDHRRAGDGHDIRGAPGVQMAGQEQPHHGHQLDIRFYVDYRNHFRHRNRPEGDEHRGHGVRGHHVRRAGLHQHVPGVLRVPGNLPSGPAADSAGGPVCGRV